MINEQIQELEELIKIVLSRFLKIDGAAWNFKASPDHWSKKEILGHLIDSATNNHQRFIRAQFEFSPSIWYDQNQWVERSNYSSFDERLLIEFWTMYNTFLVEVVRNIRPDDYLRTCKMKNGEELTLAFLIEDYIEHLKHHLHQILKSN